MNECLMPPLDAALLLRKRRAMLQQLRACATGEIRRVAILGGSTTHELAELLELLLLQRGVRTDLWQSAFAQYEQESLFPSQALREFAPQVVYLHVSWRNLAECLQQSDAVTAAQQFVQRIVQCALSLVRQLACEVVINTIELPPLRPLGSLERIDASGHTALIASVNEQLAQFVAAQPSLALHDLHWLAAQTGLQQWHDERAWLAWRQAVALSALPYLANSLAGLVAALCGRSRKVLVLDLDNTLWGGVVGDDGVDGLQMGPDGATAEAFQAFQRYLLALQQRGVVLAVCSKNEIANAVAGLRHPHCLLPPECFALIVANWQAKSDNLRTIAQTLNVGIDSLVFVDDNPAERELVRQQLPEVLVPEMGDDPSRYPAILDGCCVFDTVRLSEEDRQRTAQYRLQVEQAEAVMQYADYQDYLRSLQMHAAIAPFAEAQWPRITQLIGKTNQFNLTLRRYSAAEVQAMAQDRQHYVTLAATLRDRFVDHGLVSALVARVEGDALHVDAWLMSCRVLKRDLEKALLDVLINEARQRGITRIIGYYVAGDRNTLVRDHYRDLGFEAVGEGVWQLNLANTHPASAQYNQVITIATEDFS